MYLLRQGLCGSLQIPDIPDFSRPFLIEESLFLIEFDPKMNLEYRSSISFLM